MRATDRKRGLFIGATALALTVLCGCQQKPDTFQPSSPTKTTGNFGPQRIPSGARPPQTPPAAGNNR